VIESAVVARVELPLVCLCLLGACERGPAPPASAGESAAAVQIEPALVTELAQHRSVPIARARELVEEDALLAAELGRREPAQSLSLQRLVLARELSQALLSDAERQGPPSDSEVADLTNERWWELDRPRMVQVVHAVVLSEKENAAAAALAERIAAAVAPALSADDFQRAATAVPALDFQVRVETPPPVTADGRGLDPDKAPPFGPPTQHFAAEFAAAAQKLEHVGQLSPVVRSPFGYHVLRLLRIVEPRVLSLAERREQLHAEVMQRRALAEQRRLLSEQRQQSAPQQERSALRSIARLMTVP
jgi:hypothetical protein